MQSTPTSTTYKGYAACTFVSSGVPGAETRQLYMISRLRSMGFKVHVETCDIHKTSSTHSRFLAVHKLLAGLRTTFRKAPRAQTYFAFDPYSFIGGAILARLRGQKALFFCRNDKIYHIEQIAHYMARTRRVPRRLFLLQYLCLLLCTTYVVQSKFAATNLTSRFRAWPFTRSKQKVAVLCNDLRLPIQSPLKAPIGDALRVGFVANPAWEKKGFHIIQELISSGLFQSANLSLTLVGAGSAFDQLRATTPLLAKSNVHFSGFQKDISKLRGMVDLVIVPSIVDHFPNVVIECAALGLPMVLSDIDAHRNIFPQHPGYFPVRSKPSEIFKKLKEISRPGVREKVIANQQEGILRLKDAWGHPLARLFGFDNHKYHGEWKRDL